MDCSLSFKLAVHELFGCHTNVTRKRKVHKSNTENDYKSRDCTVKNEW